jgi:uncharacterized protein (DUF2336 family)
MSLASAAAAENPKDAENPSLIDELNAAIATGGARQRQRMLERVTDLFAAGSRGYSSGKIALFHDVLQELAADIEMKARVKLARRLAQIDTSPPELIRSLAFDDNIQVAEPILIHSQQLSDADLVENATAKSQAHLLAIAERLKLSEQVTDVLVERGDRRVVHKVVQNKGARFSLAGYEKLTIRARDDSRLTLALGGRGDLPRQYFLKLLETASATVRGKLETLKPEAADTIREAIDEVATGMQREVRQASDRYANVKRDTKRRFNGQRLSESNVHAAARGQEFEQTVIALAKLGSFPVDLVERALLDKGEDMILILARAAGCSWVTAKELLLMYVAERHLPADELGRAAQRYQTLGEKTAREVLNFYERRLKQRAEKVQAAE